MIVILRADLSETDQSEMFDTIGSWIEASQGEVASIDHWGRRRMAYEIDGQRDGYYILYQLNLPPQAPAELERDLRLNENVLRHLIIRKED
jgi:small subunit ribosomal protein S6